MDCNEISVLTVCLDFDDYLSRVVHSWLEQGFRDINVVTADDDFSTIRFCEENGLNAIKVGRRSKWLRSYYINSGLEKMNNEWTLILDSDCWLPKIKLPKDPDKNCLYGIPFVGMNIDQFNLWLKTGIRKKKINHLTTGIGFFQLFNTNYQKSKNIKYPYYNVSKKTGKGASFKFAHKWDKIKKLENEFVVCLSTGVKNRFGRSTKRLPLDKPSLIKNKLSKYKKFINNKIGITIYEK